ncbi:MAG: hypothetical protein ACQEQL_03215 [Pseudomonadota bacterium]
MRIFAINSKGNALFLILIAVALFAALSYAVTQSGRGGGSTDREQAQIKAAAFIQQVQMMHSTIQRAYLTGGYDQIFTNSDAETNSGTCYEGSNAYSPCHSIGIFNEAFDLPVLDTTAYRTDDPDDDIMWIWSSREVLINGSHLGSSETDEYIAIYWLDKELCEEINRNLHGDTTIPDLNLPNSTYGRAKIIGNADGTIDAIVPNASSKALDIGFEPGCIEEPGPRYTYIHVLRRQ